MSKTVTLAQEEMKEIRSFQEKYHTVTKRYGELKFQQKLIRTEMESLELEMDSVEMKRAALMESLQDKYGAGSIDLTTGEFSPAEQAS